jgi:Ca2+-binding RTX toxin-like protein
MKNFDIASSDVQFLQEQVSVPILRVVGYDQADGTPVYGFTRLAGSTFGPEGTVVVLGKLGTFDLSDPNFAPGMEWASYMPGNSPGLVTFKVASSFGLRNVSGLFNNISNPSSYSWGAIGNPFARLSNSDYSQYSQQDSTNAAFAPGSLVDSSALYANPFATVRDYTPRMISQLVNSSVAGPGKESAMDRIQALSGNTTITDSVTFDTTVNGVTTTVTENFQRNLNTLAGDPSLTGWQVLFGQFFDHGLDSIGKGGNISTPGGRGSKIIVPLDPSDPLYAVTPPNADGIRALSISRATVSNAQQAGADHMFRTADDIISAGTDGIYGTSDDVLGLANPEYINHVSPYIDQSQTYGSSDDVTSLLREWVLDPTTGQYVQGMRLFSGASLQQSWTRISPITGAAEETHATLPTINELRTHLLATGRADLTWEDINNFRARDAHGQVVDQDGNAANGIQAISTGSPLLLDMLNRLDAAHLLADPFAGVAGHTNLLIGFDAEHIARGADTTSVTGAYISDYINLQSGRPTALGADPANGAILSEILLRSIGDHYIAGDGRVNENFGLTAIHHVWHEDHNWQIDNLIASITEQQAADPTHAAAHGWQRVVTVPVGFDSATLTAGISIVNGHFEDAKGNYVTSGGTITWNQEKMFQAATLIVQMEYQHVAIDQYARGMTPNIPLFVSYDNTVNADVTLEYSQGAYRFGHSQLRETIDVLDSHGSLSGMVTKFALEQAFLNPAKFGEVGPTAIVQGMTRQVSSEIDEILTPSLQQALLGQPQDLAAINIMRGRDLGLPTLNTLRRSLSGGLATDIANLNEQLDAHPGDTVLQRKLDQTISLQQGLTAYTSWADYGNHLIHPESLVNFLAAYAFGGSADSLAKASMIYKLTSPALALTLTTAEEAAITSLDWTAENAATNAAIFIGETAGANKNFENIDAWVGGLAEKHIFLGQLGSTFDAIFCDQMTRLMNGDRFYYFWRLQQDLPEFTQLSSSVSTEQFKDVIERTTGAQHLTGDVFLMTDSHIELGEDPTLAANNNATVDAANHRYGNLVTSHAADANADGTTGVGVHSGSTFNPGATGIYNVTSFVNHIRMLDDGSVFSDPTNPVVNRTYISDYRPNSAELNPDGTAKYGFDSHETIAGTKFGDYIDAGDGDDTAYGEDGNDILIGNAGADHLYGENGDDSLFGGDLPDFLDGGNGNDEIHGGNDADVLIGAGGNDTIYGENFTDEIHGNSGDDYLDGGLDADFIYGGYGCDIILGQEGLDTTYGEWGDDQMFGGAQTDQLFGGRGDDILHGGAGGSSANLNVDECLGEEGFNISSYSDLSIKLDVIGDLNYQNITNVGAQVPGQAPPAQVVPFNQLLVNIQGLEGTKQADQLIGDGVANWLIGGGGNDIMSGGGGDDVIIGDRIRLDALDGAYNAAGLLGQGLLDIVQAGGGKHFTELLKAYRNFEFGTAMTSDGRKVASAIGTNDIVTYSGTVDKYTITLVRDAANNVMTDANGKPMLRIVDNRGIDTTAVGDLVIGVEKLVFGYNFEAVAAASVRNHIFINPASLPTATTYNVSQFYTDVPGSITVSVTPSTTSAGLAATIVDPNIVAGSIAYQWYSSTDGGVTSMPIAGATAALNSGVSGSLTQVVGSYNGLFGAKTVTSQWVQIGTGADDTLNGTTGANILAGLDGNDTYTVDAGDVVIEVAGAGTDTILSNLSYTLGANLENLILNGSAVSGSGNLSANAITGNAANNSLSGDAGNDTLDGGIGDDTMVGGTGDDTFILDSAADVVTEAVGEGTDTVLSTVSYTLSANVENLTLNGTAISGTGNASDNVIIGNASDNSLDGGTGNDNLSGGAGSDVYIVDSIGDVVTEAAGAGTDTVLSSVSYTLSADVENLTLTGTALTGTGNTSDNVIIGNASDNSLDGGTGNDNLSGGAGSDVYIVDSIGDVVTEAAGAGTDTVLSSVSYTLSADVENLTLTGTALTGTGNTSDNVIIGNASDNSLDGGAGNDNLSGGAGSDVYIVDSIGDVVTEAAGAGTDTVLSTVSYTLSADVENLTLNGTAIGGTGNALNNVIIGNASDNSLDGGAGNDNLSGGAGSDVYIVDSIGDVITEAAGAGTDTVLSGISYTLGTNLENLTLTGAALLGLGNTADNVILGNALANTLTGGGGNDTLNGDVGNDTMRGGIGDDVYYVDIAADVVTELSGEGIDCVFAGVSYNLGNNLEKLTLVGTAVTGTGNTLSNLITGNALANNLNGGVGSDTLVGGNGSDTYTVDNAGDVVTEVAGEGTDTVLSTVSYTLSADVENLTLNGTAIIGVGNASNNVITGNNSANSLDGGGGNDTLLGNSGNDTLTSLSGDDVLDGGTGNDRMSGGTGNDVYSINSADDIVIELASEGYDSALSSVSYTLSANVENLTLTGTALIGMGNTADNIIIGNASANTLNGGGGNDTLLGNGGSDTLTSLSGDDVLDGGSGTDYIYGGSGTDNLFGGTGVTTDILSGGSGADILNGGDGNDFANYNDFSGTDLAVNLLTGANTEGDTFISIENIDGSLSANNNLTGNTLSNILTGYNGNDTLDGSGGNDSLYGNGGSDLLKGSAGNDFLSGGAGSDRFEFSGGAIATTLNTLLGLDTIADFTVGVDKVVLSRQTFTGLSLVTGPDNTINASNFAIVTGATDAAAATSSALIVYNSTNGHLLYNRNGAANNYGTGGGQFATLSTGLTSLSATDICLIA